MKFRVVFKERSGQDGERSENPATSLDAQLADGIVLDASEIGSLEPDAAHSTEDLEEDDDFLSLSGEIWEYDVAEGREQEFKDAMLNSGVVMEFEPLESNDELGVS